MACYLPLTEGDCKVLQHKTQDNILKSKNSKISCSFSLLKSFLRKCFFFRKFKESDTYHWLICSLNARE